MATIDLSQLVTAEMIAAKEKEILLNTFKNAVQSHIDDKAKERLYDNGFTLATYTNSTIPSWAAEANAFVEWRDQVWVYAYTELAKVEQQQRAIPTVEEFINELPTITWPA